jgi:hypothetical protein
VGRPSGRRRSRTRTSYPVNNSRGISHISLLLRDMSVRFPVPTMVSTEVSVLTIRIDVLVTLKTREQTVPY